MPALPGPMPMGGGGGQPGAPTLPKSPFGGPNGPGTSPALAPGAGAGHQAAAMAQVKGMIPGLMKAANMLPVGDKARQALLRAVMALEAHFGKAADEDVTPSAMQHMAAAAQPGSQMGQARTPPPGMSLGGPAGGGGGGGAGALAGLGIS